jgi:hypothetical protein
MYELYEYINKEKKRWQTAGGVAQVVVHLPSKCSALSSNPGTSKKKKQGKKRIPVLIDLQNCLLILISLSFHC